MDEPKPTRVTPGVPPGVAPETETVQRASAGSADGNLVGEESQDVKDQAQQKAGEMKDQVKQAAPDQVGQAAAKVQQQAKENPLPFAAGGAFVAGFLFGRMTKRS